jgi:signal transduction histidine kinase
VQLLDRSDPADPQRRFVRLLKSSSENMLNLLNHLLELSLKIRSAMAEDVPPANIGDPVPIRHILTNLVRNAVKFTSAGR